MSDTEAKNDKRPGKKEPGPTAPFDSSVLGPGSQIGLFRIEWELGRGGSLFSPRHQARPPGRYQELAGRGNEEP